VPILRPSHVAAAAIAVGLVLGTSACAPASPVATHSATPVAARSSSTTSSAVEAECGIVSAANSIMLNAAADRAAGRLTAKGYSAVLNTVPQVLLWRPKGLPRSVRLEAEALDRQVGPATAGDAGPAFEPRGAPVRAAVSALGAACDANGTPTGILATSGG
jgi:hypothetical protein